MNSLHVRNECIEKQRSRSANARLSMWRSRVAEFILERKCFFTALPLSHAHFTFSHAHFSLWGRKMKMRMRESDEKTLALLVWIQLKAELKFHTRSQAFFIALSHIRFFEVMSVKHQTVNFDLKKRTCDKGTKKTLAIEYEFSLMLTDWAVHYIVLFGCTQCVEAGTWILRIPNQK